MGEAGFSIVRSGDLGSEKFAAGSYVMVENSPVEHLDSEGLSIWVCTRTSQVGSGTFNHAYFWDDTTGKSCGRDHFWGGKASGNPMIQARVARVKNVKRCPGALVERHP